VPAEGVAPGAAARASTEGPGLAMGTLGSETLLTRGARETWRGARKEPEARDLDPVEPVVAIRTRDANILQLHDSRTNTSVRYHKRCVGARETDYGVCLSG